MATFTGLETVNNIVRISTASTGTLYTVPANTYSRIHVEKVVLGASSSFTIGENAYATGGPSGAAYISSMVKNGSTLSVSAELSEVILYAGQTISTGGTATTRLTIIEYAIP